MGLPRSTYYDAPVATADEAEIVARIEAICEEFEAYGYRRVGAALRLSLLLIPSGAEPRCFRRPGTGFAGCAEGYPVDGEA